MIKKICVVTGGRADYGLLKLLMREIRRTDGLKLQLIATGSHFSQEFGSTYREIQADAFTINEKVPMKADFSTCRGICANMAKGIQGIGEALGRIKPDVMLLLGDRFETFSAAAAATIAGVPIAHLHGGELTEGAYDDAFRHAVTKLSHWHFVAASDYRKRVIQMGEEPKRVFQVGALGVDNFVFENFFSRKQIEQILGIQFLVKNLLITFHPTTLEPGQAGSQVDQLFEALDSFKETAMVFTIPGADRETKIISKKIREFVKRNPHAHVFRSLGSRLYLSLMKEVDVVVGNSSSGLLEAPLLKTPVVNIGNRQKGRIRSANVIDCCNKSYAIKKSIQKGMTTAFKNKCKKGKNLFGKKGVSRRILKILKKIAFEQRPKKVFYKTLP